MPNGYGTVFRHDLAHRVSYESFVGKIPKSLDIDHLCRNRKCINPSHLEPVTRSENIKRGIGPAMISKFQLAKTHCPKGHEYSSKNLYVCPNGRRNCRTCMNTTSRLWKQRLALVKSAL